MFSQRTDLQTKAKSFRKITTSRYITTFAIATGMKEKNNIVKYRSFKYLDECDDKISFATFSWYFQLFLCKMKN
jgi:hypothetical protein